MPSQAEKIIDRFRGARPLAEAIGYRPAAVYRWTYPREKGGTGGLVPTGAVDLVKDAARRLRVRILDSDWIP